MNLVSRNDACNNLLYCFSSYIWTVVMSSRLGRKASLVKKGFPRAQPMTGQYDMQNTIQLLAHCLSLRWVPCGVVVSFVMGRARGGPRG